MHLRCQEQPQIVSANRRHTRIGFLMATLLPLWLCSVGCVMNQIRREQVIKPEPLRPGDTIAFVAPAGPLDRERMELVKQRMEKRGFNVVIPEDLYSRRGYLAGDDARRARELMAAFENPEVNAVFPGTGGYGTTRILDMLDYESIRRNPKVMVGFSDITGLHLAIGKKAGLITFHSPSPAYGLGSKSNLSDFSAEFFWRAILAKHDPGQEGYIYEIPDYVATIETLSPGVCRGRLTGGNLSLICALMGTPYEIETEGKILFVEDVGERPYRIDRFLSQLKLAGKLDDAAGIVLGRFRDCSPEKGKDSLTLDQVFDDYFSKSSIPVIKGFPVGHAKFNATMPMGAMAELDADNGTLRIIEEPTKE